MANANQPPNQAANQAPGQQQSPEEVAQQLQTLLNVLQQLADNAGQFLQSGISKEAVNGLKDAATGFALFVQELMGQGGQAPAQAPQGEMQAGARAVPAEQAANQGRVQPA